MLLRARSTIRPDVTQSQEQTVSHQPPKESKKKPLLTAKQKKAAKHERRHANDAPRFIKH